MQEMMHEDVLESLPLGILIFNPQGNPVLANSYAQQVCGQLLKKYPALMPNSTSSKFPQPILRICQAVLESRELFSEQPMIIEDEIPLSGSAVVQIRARWLDLEIDPYILIMLETQQQAQPIVEAQEFNLTERETEVWLLRRAGYPYKAIAAHLKITLNTVKKHIKSIHAKREMAEGLGESFETPQKFVG